MTNTLETRVIKAFRELLWELFRMRAKCQCDFMRCGTCKKVWEMSDAISDMAEELGIEL